MFEFVRTHTKLLQFLLVLLIFPSFVFFGIQGYSRFTEGGNATVAKVDGRAITRVEWDQAHQRQVERLRQQMPNIDIKMFDNAMMRRETLDALVRERVLLAAANRQNLLVSDERLQRLFVEDPQFAALRNADGSVNQAVLAAQGMTSQTFVAQLRQELGMQQVLRGVANSTLAPNSAATRALDALFQRREVAFARFDAKAHAARIQPSDEQIEAYYKANEGEFRAPEQATIEYVVLDVELLKKGIAVPDEDLRKYYTENAARYTVAEERRARHILIKADKDAGADVKQKAKARAEALLAEVRKSPASFAELAKKNSDDAGSAGQGGDLDFSGRGAMVAKPLEDAVFAMKPGEIGEIVTSEFGYHVVKLEAVRGGDKKAFDTVRREIEEEVRKQLAAKRWAEAAEQFTNTVYEQADSLQPVIDKLKLEKRSATVQRSPAAGATGALGSTKLLDAVFANDSVRNKRNTDAVEVGPNQLASARVVSHQPARTLPLAEVRDRVRERVVATQAAAAARKDGEARLAQLRQSGQGDLPQKAVVSRGQTRDLQGRVVDAVLQADSSKLPAFIGVDLGEEGYVTLRIDAVLPRETQAGDAARLRSQYGQALSSAETRAYLEALKTRYKADTSDASISESAASEAAR
jgi:peptidyl-prolyl cis-trans isomerase D